MIAEWLPGYDRTASLHGHIACHAALGALERGDPEGALVIYADHIQPSVSAGMPVNAVSDTAAFLWRLQACGHTAPTGLWEEAAATGNRAAVEQRVEALGDLVQAGALAAGPVVPAICRAALAFAEEDHAGCARILEPVAAEIVRIGGSGAQREMIEDMLLLALMRSGEAVKARALLDRRLHRRPSPRDMHWQSLLAV